MKVVIVPRKLERCGVVGRLNRPGFELPPFVVLCRQVIDKFLCQLFRRSDHRRADNIDLNVISDYGMNVRGRSSIAYYPQIEFCKPAKNIRIISAISNALKFGHPCGADHIGRFSLRLRLTTYKAVVVGIVGKVARSFLHRDITRRATSVFDIEWAKYVFWVRSNFVGHRPVDFAERPH